MSRKLQNPLLEGFMAGLKYGTAKTSGEAIIKEAMRAALKQKLAEGQFMRQLLLAEFTAKKIADRQELEDRRRALIEALGERTALYSKRQKTMEGIANVYRNFTKGKRFSDASSAEQQGFVRFLERVGNLKWDNEAEAEDVSKILALDDIIKKALGGRPLGPVSTDDVVSASDKFLEEWRKLYPGKQLATEKTIFSFGERSYEKILQAYPSIRKFLGVK